MALNWRTTRAMPRLRTYKDAADYEAKVKPIRGDKDKLKPLGKRSQKYRHIRREDNGDIGVYTYKEQMVLRFKPNGDVLVYDCACWNKVSYNDVITTVTGIHMETHAGKAWHYGDYLRPNPRANWVAGKGWVHPDPKDMPKNVFRYDTTNAIGYPVWRYVNPPKVVTHQINRKAMREVTARYKPTLAYIEALMKLNPERVSEEEFGSLVGMPRPDIKMGDYTTIWQWRNALREAYPMQRRWSNTTFLHKHAKEMCALLASSDPGDQYKAYAWLSHGATGNNNRRFGIEDVMDFAKHSIIMHHHKKVLEPVVHEGISPVRDRYAWAIPSAK